ncbi:hypothetical protein BB560_002910 [Smittium megazygosporum]|uniref:Pseudouridine synthase RsuA/RluA-like domain-containing protein n=1 Tax=Smittium megazygosporum TaxID=133381 RepID=A0A2T9ZDF8_9FUNG|nr:hypothetical protein BB560_002910 [Smittium megazygosporum]
MTPINSISSKKRSETPVSRQESPKKKKLINDPAEYITNLVEVKALLSSRFDGSSNPAQKSDASAEQKPTYTIENGLRKVAPYWYRYIAHAKERWFGRTVLEVFSSEFKGKDSSYYSQAIQTQKIMVNGKATTLDYSIKNGDIITHLMHRHESPVPNKKIKILSLAKLSESCWFLGIEKPVGIPVHPTGKFNFNSLLEILKHEYGIHNIFISNRLDRLVSGVMVVPTSRKAAQIFARQLESNLVNKTYICRILGDFDSDSPVICNAPIRTIAHKLSLNYVDFENGKPCSTEFTKLFSSGNTSVVLCKPLTGRTHQIRVHLQYLGFPIVNDPIYCNPSVWGIGLGTRGRLPDLNEEFLGNETYFSSDGYSLNNKTSTKDLHSELKNTVPAEENEMSKDTQRSIYQTVINNMQNQIRNNLLSTFSEAFITPNNYPRLHKTSAPNLNNNSSDELGKNANDPKYNCPDCDYEEPRDSFDVEEMGIWLHALSYSGPNWSFETETPDWAKPEYEANVPDFLLKSIEHIQNSAKK